MELFAAGLWLYNYTKSLNSASVGFICTQFNFILFGFLMIIICPLRFFFLITLLDNQQATYVSRIYEECFG